MKPRIHILGGPGSGKSFIAAKLAEKFSVPACDLDDLFWDRNAPRYGTRADPQERDRQLANLVAQDGWVIEGVYYQRLAQSFKVASLIVALTPPIWIRHLRVIRRFIFRRWGRLPSKHESFADLRRLLRWSHRYDRNNLLPAREFITGHGRELVVCRTSDEAMAVADKLPAQLSGNPF